MANEPSRSLGTNPANHSGGIGALTDRQEVPMPDPTRKRDRMVERQIVGRGISNPKLLEAMRQVPRERFVPDNLAEFAYDDGPLPIGCGQTISQPYIVARMIDAAEIAPGDRV